MATVQLTKGYTAEVDDVDLPLLSRYSWYAMIRKGKARAYTGWRVGQRRVKHVGMHQMLMPGCPLVDHKDGDTLNNRRSNLRPATICQNSANSKKREGCSSQFKGVRYYVRKRKWAASICSEGKRYWLGYYDSEEMAGRAYDEKARELFGKFAKLNFASAVLEINQ